MFVFENDFNSKKFNIIMKTINFNIKIDVIEDRVIEFSKITHCCNTNYYFKFLRFDTKFMNFNIRNNVLSFETYNLKFTIDNDDLNKSNILTITDLVSNLFEIKIDLNLIKYDTKNRKLSVNQDLKIKYLNYEKDVQNNSIFINFLKDMNYNRFTYTI